MKTSWILSTVALAAGHVMAAGALAAPLPVNGMAVPVGADVVRIQAVQSQAIQDRIARLQQHRAILESALQPPVSTEPSQPPEPQARPLQPPEPQARALQPPEPQARALQPPEPVTETAAMPPLTCEAAAEIVTDFGFSEIGSQDCSGDLYRFSAMRDGTEYAIGISAATGEIAEVSRQ